jgi:GAF domain-containing protein
LGTHELVDEMMNLNLEHYRAILTGRWITDLANTSAYLMEHMPDINWVGFYLWDGSQLVLGPFQGRVACTEIALNRGVCGHAATHKKSIIVENVDQFPGHIVCDSRSRSEMVVPMIKHDQLLGVLDIDSARLNRFSSQELEICERLMQILLEVASHH